MATVQECRDALGKLAARFADIDPSTREKQVVERTLSCRIPDLGVVFCAQLRAEGIDEIREYGDGEAPKTQVGFTIASDDLIALVEERLSFGKAILTGRVKVAASLVDLVRLRGML